MERIQPISEKHSISRVIATIFLPQSVIKPEVTLTNLQEKKLLSNYHKKSETLAKTFKFNQNTMGVSQDKIVGLNLEEYSENGDLKSIFRLENTPNNQAIIEIESREYKSWNEFKEKIGKEINELSSILQIYISALKLTYVDEFLWIEKNITIDTNIIFKQNSELLNKKFLESKNGTLIMISQGENNSNTEERTEISFNNDHKRIALSHQFAQILEDFKNFNEIYTDGTFDSYFDKAHKANKNFLSSILTIECQKKIGLI